VRSAHCGCPRRCPPRAGGPEAAGDSEEADETDPIQVMRARLATPEGITAYRRRGVTVEPVNGHLKDRHRHASSPAEASKPPKPRPNLPAQPPTCSRSGAAGADQGQQEIPRPLWSDARVPPLPYPRIAPRQNPTASATCADRPKPTFTLVSTGLSPKLIFTGTLRPAMTTTPTLRPKIDQRL
jgi:hypothetical protein